MKSKITFSKKAVAAIMSFALLSSAVPMTAQAGVPVIDPSNLAQSVAQVQNQIQQITQLRNQVTALTGNGNYGDLLNNPLIRQQLNQYLPNGYSDIFEAARRNDLGALQSVVNQAIAKEQAAQTAQTGQERLAATRALTQASMDSMMRSLNVQANDVNNLLYQVNMTSSMAQKQDLMNTLAVKQAQINVSLGQMNLMMKQAEMQEQMASKQAVSDFHNKFNK